MAGSQEDSSTSSHMSRIWSTVKCDTRFCEKCEKVPFNDERYGGQSSMSGPGRQGIQFEEGLVAIRLGFELVDYWPQLSVLARSAKNCDFCKLIRNQLKKAIFPAEFKRGWLRVQPYYHVAEPGFHMPKDVGLVGLLADVLGKAKDEDEFTQLVCLRFSIDAFEGQCKRWLSLPPRPPSEILGRENISKITARLKTSHKKPSTFLPTRLLDLASPGKEPMFARLVTKEEVHNERRTFPMYVTLSYRWGSQEESKSQSKTTAENLGERMTDIDLGAVSRVIQDAVTVCKVLGVRYLWVDALCIVQGDVQDWEHESTKMGDIFRNSYFTICASSIESCHESFLSQTIDTLDVPFVSRVDQGIRGTYRLIARSSIPYELDFKNDWEDINGSWHSRGWVFQEIVLSPKLLIFGRTMVVFQIKGQVEESYFFQTGEMLNHYGWRNLVRGYSASELTYEQDRFPAISGLAKLYAEQLQDQYLAGIWRRDLCLSLFFDLYEANCPKRRSFSECIDAMESRHSYIAPSWSWAAHKQYIEFGSHGFYPDEPKHHARPESNVVDARCIVRGLDHFGIVEDGYIVLSGKMLRPTKDELSVLYGTDRDVEGVWYHLWCLFGQSPVLRVCLDGFLDREDDRYDGLVLLLLGSCDAHGTKSDPSEDSDESSTCFSNDEYLSQDEEHTVQEPQKSEYDSEDQLLEEASCQSASSISGSGTERPSEGERSAYGLVLYPAKGMNVFYRVGVFVSDVGAHSPHGGMKFCEDWEVETVKII